MNLVEAMVASAMFVTSSSCSLQLWSSSASWARQAEAQQQQAAKREGVVSVVLQILPLCANPVAGKERRGVVAGNQPWVLL